MDSKLIAAIIAAVVALGVVVAFPKENDSGEKTVELGSSAGPIDQNNYHCWAGVCEYFGSMSINTASSTSCAIQSPAATSTLIALNVRVDVASSTATNWFFGVGTTAFATSSALGSTNSVAAGKQAYFQASTSPAAGSNTVLAPNSYVIVQNNLGITAGDTAGTGFVPSGRCVAKFSTPQ